MISLSLLFKYLLNIHHQTFLWKVKIKHISKLFNVITACLCLGYFFWRDALLSVSCKAKLPCPSRKLALNRTVCYNYRCQPWWSKNDACLIQNWGRTCWNEGDYGIFSFISASFHSFWNETSHIWRGCLMASAKKCTSKWQFLIAISHHHNRVQDWNAVCFMEYILWWFIFRIR